MSYFAYMIRSESTNRNYYGHTSDLAARVQSHNSSQNRYTRGKGPWKLLAHIECETRGEAMRIEEKLKKMKNPSRALNWLKKNGSVS